VPAASLKTGIALAGIAMGLAAATAVARALRTQLFGVALFEPAVYIGSAALLVLVVVNDRADSAGPLGENGSGPRSGNVTSGATVRLW
jgi:hypothetical protein